MKLIELLESLRTDIPNDDWLASAIDYSKKQGRNRYGVPFMNKTTAYLKNQDYVEIPTKLAASLPGMSGEQNNVRTRDLEAIMGIMEKTGKLPIVNGKEYYPFIQVAYNGEAWVNEGNHRIMAADRLGWPTIKVVIQYHDGGERIKQGPLYPSKIGLNS